MMWRLVELLSGMLARDERDAVRGDIAESGESAAQALRDVLGLVLRRQAMLWKGWRPWLALAALVVPLGMQLGRSSALTAHTSSIYIWMYANNWDWALVKYPGFRHDIAYYAGTYALSYLMLACSAWAGGIAVGWLSRRAISVNAALFCAVVLTTPYPKVPFAGGSSNAAVFSLTFYRVVFPVIVQTALVLLPAIWGMRLGSREKIA
jgi:hypothetical protein